MRSNQDILALKFDDSWNTGCEQSVRSFLKNLLVKVMVEGEDFSGHRPWGNSEWQAPLIICLVTNGVIRGSIREYENGLIDLDDYDQDEFERIIKELIWAM